MSQGHQRKIWKLQAVHINNYLDSPNIYSLLRNNTISLFVSLIKVCPGKLLGLLHHILNLQGSVCTSRRWLSVCLHLFINETKLNTKYCYEKIISESRFSGIGWLVFCVCVCKVKVKPVIRCYLGHLKFCIEIGATSDTEYSIHLSLNVFLIFFSRLLGLKNIQKWCWSEANVWENKHISSWCMSAVCFAKMTHSFLQKVMIWNWP